MPHELGSSHGVTRIIRLAYFEHSDYVPAPAPGVRALARAPGRGRRAAALHRPGSSRAASGSTTGVLRSCADHDLPHEAITGAEANARFPAYRLPDELPVVFQPDGGFVLPERAIVAHASGALALGATLRARERVLEWEETESGVRVRTDRGAYEAERLVLTAGAWSQAVARLPAGLVRAVRQSLAWLQPTRPEIFAPSQLPVFNLVLDGTHYYGFPEFGIPGFKVGLYELGGESGDPDGISREPTLDDELPLRAFAERYFPDGAGPALSLKTCLFEPSPDEHFLIDLHPESPSAVVGAGFSGHGFKFCPVVGEILADLALEGSTRHDIGLFRLDRFDAAVEGEDLAHDSRYR